MSLEDTTLRWPVFCARVEACCRRKSGMGQTQGSQGYTREFRTLHEVIQVESGSHLGIRHFWFI